MSNPEKNKFDIICNTVDNGIIVLDKDLRVLFWNRWLETRTGLEASNITQLSHIVNHKFLYKKASLNPINRHFLI